MNTGIFLFSVTLVSWRQPLSVIARASGQVTTDDLSQRNLISDTSFVTCNESHYACDFLKYWIYIQWNVSNWPEGHAHIIHNILLRMQLNV